MVAAGMVVVGIAVEDTGDQTEPGSRSQSAQVSSASVRRLLPLTTTAPIAVMVATEGLALTDIISHRMESVIHTNDQRWTVARSMRTALKPSTEIFFNALSIRTISLFQRRIATGIRLIDRFRSAREKKVAGQVSPLAGAARRRRAAKLQMREADLAAA